MLAMYFSRRSFSSLRLSRLVMLLALRERDDQLPFIVIVIIVRIAMITIASYCSPLREYLYGHHYHHGHHDCLPQEIITMVIETTHWTQLRLYCNDKKVFTESQKMMPSHSYLFVYSIRTPDSKAVITKVQSCRPLPHYHHLNHHQRRIRNHHKHHRHHKCN